jgi:hypothetical protein
VLGLRLRLRGMVLIYFVNEYHLGALPSASLEVGFAGLRLRLRLRGMVLIYFVNEYHLVAGLRLRGVRNIDNLVNCPLGFIKYFIILNFKTRL